MKRAAVVLALALAAGEACADAIETAGSVGAILLPAAAAAKRHYTSDVVAGAAIGIAANLLFTHPREHVSIAFDVGRGHAGSSITLAW